MSEKIQSYFDVLQVWQLLFQVANDLFLQREIFLTNLNGIAEDLFEDQRIELCWRLRHTQDGPFELPQFFFTITSKFRRP